MFERYHLAWIEQSAGLLLLSCVHHLGVWLMVRHRRVKHRDGNAEHLKWLPNKEQPRRRSFSGTLSRGKRDEANPLVQHDGRH
jgi:hypothetical protein